MSTPGCCRHCGEDCTAGMPNGSLYGHQSQRDAAAWDDEECPACAVADLIAEALQRAHGVVDHDCQSQDEHDGLLRAQDVVAKIRGES